FPTAEVPVAHTPPGSGPTRRKGMLLSARGSVQCLHQPNLSACVYCLYGSLWQFCDFLLGAFGFQIPEQNEHGAGTRQITYEHRTHAPDRSSTGTTYFSIVTRRSNDTHPNRRDMEIPR